MDIRTRRAYDDPGKDDGYRILIDRLWPRGIKKEALKLDEWNKDLSPSEELRKWFGHEPEKMAEFRKRYRKELEQHSSAVDSLLERVRNGRVTLVYAAHDEEHNNAEVMREYLKERLG